jgi:hypothetical protein
LSNTNNCCHDNEVVLSLARILKIICGSNEAREENIQMETAYDLRVTHELNFINYQLVFSKYISDIIHLLIIYIGRYSIQALYHLYWEKNFFHFCYTVCCKWQTCILHIAYENKLCVDNREEKVNKLNLIQCILKD